MSSPRARIREGVLVPHALCALVLGAALPPAAGAPAAGRADHEGRPFVAQPAPRLVFGKIRAHDGKPWLELFAAWPALGGKPASCKVWIDQGGKRSSAYTVLLADGRSTFYDARQLPEGFRDLEGKHVRLRFTDLLGTVRTWRGDWREPVAPDVPTPPDYAGPAR